MAYSSAPPVDKPARLTIVTVSILVKSDIRILMVESILVSSISFIAKGEKCFD